MRPPSISARTFGNCTVSTIVHNVKDNEFVGIAVILHGRIAVGFSYPPCIITNVTSIEDCQNILIDTLVSNPDQIYIPDSVSKIDVINALLRLKRKKYL